MDFELFVKYACYSDGTTLTNEEEVAFNKICKRMKSIVNKRHAPRWFSIKLYKTNRYNIFIHGDLLSMYSFEFADTSCMVPISRDWLTQDIDIDELFKFLVMTTPKMKDLLTRKLKKYAKLL